MKPISSHEHNDQTRDEIYRNVSLFDDQRQTDESRLSAAVALTIVAHEHESAILVTRRSSRLKEHKGQWALPGGRLDDGETAIEAALREMDEEINLKLTENHVIGMLDDYVTRSGYTITPVVLWSDMTDTDLRPNPDEVASIHAFSFQELARPDSPNLETIPESDREVLSMNYHDDVMYAPTAAMLYQFREVAIEGRATRVLHFDQPLFAWK
jgi:8-oxo-dGTP pyrophosphatase MutT (NUDIX family)